jgi:hypothetical protein
MVLMPSSTPMPLRVEKELHDLLDEGTRRTPHKKQELIRLTLRRHLRAVIEQEAAASHPKRITNVEPWRKGALARAYRRVQSVGWEEVEDAALHAQGQPDFED